MWGWLISILSRGYIIRFPGFNKYLSPSGVVTDSRPCSSALSVLIESWDEVSSDMVDVHRCVIYGELRIHKMWNRKIWKCEIWKKSEMWNEIGKLESGNVKRKCEMEMWNGNGNRNGNPTSNS